MRLFSLAALAFNLFMAPLKLSPACTASSCKTQDRGDRTRVQGAPVLRESPARTPRRRLDAASAASAEVQEAARSPCRRRLRRRQGDGS